MKIHKTELVFNSQKIKKRVLKRRNPSPYEISYIEGIGNPITKDNTIKAPFVFSILKNYNETLNFFDKLDKAVRSDHPVYLNMSGIIEMTEDAVLYLISRLLFYDEEFPGNGIAGNFPRSSKCEEILSACGFHEYVQTKRKRSSTKSKLLRIEDGNETRGETVESVLEFVNSHVTLTVQNFGKAFGIIEEIITNSKNHAFEPNYKHSKWWFIALADKENKIVHITVLDNGYGIPSTIRRNFNEKVSEIFLKFSSIFGDKRIKEFDIELIVSALNGKFRTSTGLGHRGTGLPAIFDATGVSQIDNLIIISNFAYIRALNYKNIDLQKVLKHSFQGTLISWDFVEETK